MKERWEEFLAEALDWSAGRLVIPRALLLLYCAQAGVRHLLDPFYGDFFGGITFGIHELGHVVFMGLGPFLASFGGTFWQLAVPVIAGVLFVRQPDYFGIAIAGCWLSFSLFGVALYLSDARTMDLPLVGLGSDPQHDWNYMLSRLGLLAWDTRLAFLVRAAAFAVWAAAIGFGARLVLQMHRTSR
ncbi:MAG: hypothetical protein ABIT01_04195 [Thermoanaerobaculia bacterium]